MSRPGTRTRWAGPLGAGGLLALVLLALGARARPTADTQDCPSPPPVTISPQLPADVCIPTGFGGNPIAFFDDYSWRAFLALVWPVASGQRGVPDPAQPLGAPGPLVFETFKQDWEMFQPQGAPPSEWSSYAGANPCGATVAFGDLVLASFSKYGDLGEATFGGLVGPLVTQNRQYVRYLTSFNQTEFEQISSQKLYLRANLVANVTFPSGALDVKSAWMDMTGVTDPSRYYTRTAYVMNPADSTCSARTVGLIGLHIVQKTPSRPQWIWSTFEHVDLIPQPGATAPFALHDSTATPMPPSNPYPFPPPDTTPPPFNVQRLMPINPSTLATNASYRDSLQGRGTVWANYQLVMTQWPTTPDSATLPGTPAFTFPGFSPTSAFANLSMETFDQTNIRTGCMNCHNATKDSTDFLWSLAVNAWPEQQNSAQARLLRNLLQASRGAPRPAQVRKDTP